MDRFQQYINRLTQGNPQMWTQLKEQSVDKHHKGWMQKKSTSMMHQFQDRYFIVTNDGNQLAYFHDDKPSSKPQGAIDIELITEIKQMSKKVFVIGYPGRDFELKAKNQQECEAWLTALNVAKVGLTEVTRKDSSPRKQLGGNNSRRQSKAWKTIDPEVFQTIAHEKEQVIQDDASSDGGKKEKSSIFAFEKLQMSNEDLIKQTGMESYLKVFEKEFTQNRIICGYLAKRTKGKIKTFVKRWFLLVSAKSLYPSVYNDEGILQENALPAYIELDTLYQFGEDEEGQFRPRNGIKMLDCQEIIIKDMQKSKETGYSFKINVGDRIFHLMATTESERMKWHQALKVSFATTKEINNPFKIVLNKNIDPILQLYDSEPSLLDKREKLKQKISKDMERIKFQALKDSDHMQNLDNLMNYLTPLYQDMLEIMKACIVKDPPRRDIIWEYTEYLHEIICEIITRFWDKNYDGMESVNLLRLANWMNLYGEKVKEYYTDDRIKLSIVTLLEIFINRSVESCESVIQGIIDYERSCVPFENENSQLVSQAPYDLFKIINEGIDHAYKQCPIQEICSKLGFFAKTLIAHFQNGLIEILDENISQEKRIAICNNTLSLISQTNEVSRRLQQLGKYTDDEMDEIFNVQAINKKFIGISDNSRDVFFESFFANIPQHFKPFFLELKIQDVLQDLISPAHRQLVQLHDSFSRKIWKQFLDVFVIFYFNCFIMSCSKAKSNHLKFFLEQLDYDKDLLNLEFKNFLFPSQISPAMTPFVDMKHFLTGESVSILEPCQNLRKFFGCSFTDKTIKLLLTIRSDISKEKRRETQEACSDMIREYNMHHMDEENQASQFLTVLGLDDEEQDKNNQQSEEEKISDRETTKNTLQTFKKQKTMRMSFATRDAKQVHQFVQIVQQFIDEGFLQKRRIQNDILHDVHEVFSLVTSFIPLIPDTQYTRCYFRLKKGKLYWYGNEHSLEAQNKIDLHQIDDIHADAQKELLFSLLAEDGRQYEFKADTKELRDLWVKSILQEQQHSDQANLQKIEAIKTGAGKHLIIKDYDAMARKERKKQKAEERRQKRLEKEQERKFSQPDVKKNVVAQAYGLQDSMQHMEVRKKSDIDLQKNKVGCCEGILICLGLRRDYAKQEND